MEVVDDMVDNGDCMITGLKIAVSGEATTECVVVEEEAIAVVDICVWFVGCRDSGGEAIGIPLTSLSGMKELSRRPGVTTRLTALLKSALKAEDLRNSS